MPIHFHKMHGAGNDFVLLDLRDSRAVLDPGTAAHLADRRRGVGCDQVLVLRASASKGCLARYEVLNADGNPAQQCGNGVRCIGLYLDLRGELGMPPPAPNSDRPATESPARMNGFLLESPVGVVRLRRCGDGEFEVAMGEPRFSPREIPFDDGHAKLSREPHDGGEPSGRYRLELGGTTVSVAMASMGNPHAVTLVDDVGAAPVADLGPRISAHPAFAEGCNAGFAEVRDRQNIHLRVYERGSGETLACGSGACAAVAVLQREGRVGEAVNVFLPGGHLMIKWKGAGHELTMKGPAAHVFRGTLDE